MSKNDEILPRIKSILIVQMFRIGKSNSTFERILRIYTCKKIKKKLLNEKQKMTLSFSVFCCTNKTRQTKAVQHHSLQNAFKNLQHRPFLKKGYVGEDGDGAESGERTRACGHYMKKYGDERPQKWGRHRNRQKYFIQRDRTRD